MKILLWILAFIGVVLIYGGDKLIKKISKSEEVSKTEFLVKLIGVLVSAAALVALYVTGSFK